MSDPACRLLLPCLALVACSDMSGVPALGDGSNTAELRDIVTAAEGLNVPRDLAFHPTADELWVVNYGNNSATLVSAPGTEAQHAWVARGFGGQHFLAQPSGIAFGGNGRLATSQEEDERTQGPNGTPWDFMGPTLWTADSDEFNGGHASHYDMLHNSPNATGIAHEADNVYWVVDGLHESLTRYDFGDDHGPGGADHSDGIVARYVEGAIGYVPEVSSGAEYDAATGLLYVADTGNGRIAVLDTTTGVNGANTFPNYDGTAQYRVDDAKLWTLVGDLGAPSGLALREDVLYVTDNETSEVLAFDLGGKLLDVLQTDLPAGSLQGMAFDPEGRLYVVDTLGQRVLRIDPQ